MSQQNVTISLTDELIREARRLAVDQGMSLSGFVAAMLKERIEATHRSHEARDQDLALLQTGLPLGTNGAIPWIRESLHMRNSLLIG